MLTAITGARGMTIHHNQPAVQPQQPAQPSLRNVVIKGRWRIMETIGKGAFGEVYSAMDLQTQETVAIKVESPACKKPVLKLEISVMRKLQDCPFVCTHIAAGRFTWPNGPSLSNNGLMSPVGSPTVTEDPPVYSYMVMELLGQNLSEIRRKAPHGKFSLATTALLAKQMLRAIEALHDIGILHRDIKPGNFCMGYSDPMTPPPVERKRCFLIDFGLSRRFLSQDGTVREARSKVGFRGTARYASVSAHLGIDLGRVDDLWSFFYLIVEFLKGQLPWKGKEKEKIGEMKQKINGYELCGGLPSPVFSMYEYLSKLGYYDRPDYDYLHGLVHTLFVMSGRPESIPYDWDLPQDLSTNSAADATVSESMDVQVHGAAIGGNGLTSVNNTVTGSQRATPLSALSPGGHNYYADLNEDHAAAPNPAIARQDSTGRWWDRTTLHSTTSASHASAPYGSSPPASGTLYAPPTMLRQPSGVDPRGLGLRSSVGPVPMSRTHHTMGAPPSPKDVAMDDAGDDMEEDAIKNPPPLPSRTLRQPPTPIDTRAATEGGPSTAPSLVPTPPTEPPKLKTVFRGRRYLKYSGPQ